MSLYGPHACVVSPVVYLTYMCGQICICMRSVFAGGRLLLTHELARSDVHAVVYVENDEPGVLTLFVTNDDAGIYGAPGHTHLLHMVFCVHEIQVEASFEDAM